MMMMMMMKMMIVLKFVEDMFFHEKNSNNNLREERLPRFVIAWPLSQCIAKKPLLWQEFLNASLRLIWRQFLVCESFELCSSVENHFYEKRFKKQKFPTSLSLHQALFYSIFSFINFYILSRHIFVRQQSVANLLSF